LNQNDATHDEMNAIYAGNQAVPLYTNPPSPIPYTGQPPHPMANMYMNQYHESMLYAGGFQGCCSTSSIYGHKLGWFLQITVTVFFWKYHNINSINYTKTVILKKRTVG
jgi:hypothetical protein